MLLQLGPMTTEESLRFEAFRQAYLFGDVPTLPTREGYVKVEPDDWYGL